MVAGRVLSISVSLYAVAIWAGIVRGPDTFLAGVCAGCASIMMGVWVGILFMEKPELLGKDK